MCTKIRNYTISIRTCPFITSDQYVYFTTDKGSVSDSVFSDGSVIRSVSEYADEDSDDPLDEYETQYFGFTPKSFMNGGNVLN